MHYEIRLKFINYIKKKFDLRNTPNYATILFYFNGYENFDEIKIKINPDSNEINEYQKQRRGEEIGICVLHKRGETDCEFYFEDAFLMYQENIFLSECTLNEISYGYRKSPSMEQELNELVLMLKGKHNPQRIYNC